MLLMLFSGVALSIVKANGWIVVPTFCVVWCYLIGFYSATVYSYGKGVLEGYKSSNQNHINQMKGN